MLSKLAELIFVDVLRRYVTELPDGGPGSVWVISGVPDVSGADALSRRAPTKIRGGLDTAWPAPPVAGQGRAATTRAVPSLAFPAASVLAESATIKAARRLNRAAGMIAGCVLADSAMENYRGSFHNKAMWTPLISSALSLAVSVHGHRDKRHGAHRGRDLVYAAAGLTGIIGTGFHLYNITKKPGGFSWQNVFYSAPIGAPAALSLSGLMGFLSERVRDNEPGTSPTIAGTSAGRVVAALTSASLLGTMGEAGLLHFRGAYHNPFMSRCRPGRAGCGDRRCTTPCSTTIT